MGERERALKSAENVISWVPPPHLKILKIVNFCPTIEMLLHKFCPKEDPIGIREKSISLENFFFPMFGHTSK